MQLPSGTFLQGGKYKIESLLGQGGFGITYLGLQTGLNRKVAIKEFFMKDFCERCVGASEISVSQASSENVNHFRNKFLKEAQNIAQMDNPHIIHIYDVFEENGTAYYVMEYLEEGSLDDQVKKQGRLSETEALNYIHQIADALKYIHAKNILHLDIKPSNVLLRKDQVVLIDFGLSKRYDELGGQTSTTPSCISKGYAPIEQYTYGGVAIFTPSTDIYALGATFYKLLTGVTPPEATLLEENELSALSVSISNSTSNAVRKAMSFRRRDRPQSINDFQALLEEKVDIDISLIKNEETKLSESYETNNVKVKSRSKLNKVWHAIIVFLFALDLLFLFDAIFAVSTPIVDNSVYNTLTTCSVHSPILGFYYGHSSVITRDYGENARSEAFQKAMSEYKVDLLPKLWMLIINTVLCIMHFIYKENKYYIVSVILLSLICFLTII